MTETTQRRLANAYIEREASVQMQIIINDRYMWEITRESLEVLRAGNDASDQLFQRGSAIVRIQVGDDGVSAEVLSHAALRGELDRAAQFIKVDGDGTVRPARPPQDVVADILSLQSTGTGLPELKDILGCPTYLTDGTLLASDGYHPPSGLFIFTNGLSGVSSYMPLHKAKDLLLNDLLGDFPFAEDGSRAHAIAAMILPFVRELIKGPTPLHLVDAPARGTGKGLLTDIIAGVTLGSAAYVMTLSPEEAEVDKRITSVLLAGHPMVLLDNVTSLTSSSLSAVLTTVLWRGRKLGRSEIVQVPNRALWIATGNNVRLSNELIRRIVPIRLDAEEEQPELRTGFRHGNLLEWTLEHRGELVSATVSLVRAWLDAGRPKGRGTLGRYESWVEVIGGILAVADIPGFLSNRTPLYEHSDQETREWSGYVIKWWERYRALPVTARDLFEVAKENGLLLALWGGRSPLSAQQRLGHALSARRDRVFGAYILRISTSPGETGNLAYYLEVSGKEKAGSKTHETPITPEVVPDNDGRQGGVSAKPSSKTPSSTPQNASHPTDIHSGVSGVFGVSEASHSARREGRV